MAASYRRRPGLRVAPHERGFVVTPEGGHVVVDPAVLRLLARAEDRSLDDVLAQPDPDWPTPLARRAALACLAEAGLLERMDPHRPDARAVAPSSEALVSAVVVAWNGIPWLEVLLPSLGGQTHRGLEVIIVDNGSRDDTAAWAALHHPECRLLRRETGGSLAAAINAGVDASRGEHLLILNQDIRLEPDAVAQLVAVAEDDGRCAAVVPKLRLMNAPGFLNGLGNRVEGHSWGTDNAFGHLDLGQFDGWNEVPSACFAAALIPRSAWDVNGPVDEGFALYYEDSEWCYRARARGLTVRAAPGAVAYHAFGGSGEDSQSGDLTPSKLSHVVYGRLRFALKLLPSGEVNLFVRQYLREDFGGLRQAMGNGQVGMALAYVRGWSRTLLALPSLWSARRALRGQRVSPTAVIDGLEEPMPAAAAAGPELTAPRIVQDYAPQMIAGRTRPIPEFTGARKSVLTIVSHDVVDRRMAGPGLRCLEMARALASDVDILLAVPNHTTLEVPGVPLVKYDPKEPATLQALVDNSDAAVVSGYLLAQHGFFEHTRARLVVDLYDPLILENLHYHRDGPAEGQDHLMREVVEVTNRGIRLGDFFLCGSERQRDFWLGVLAANGRVNPRTYREDATLRKLLDVVGIGLPERGPSPGPGLRGQHPAVPADAKVVLWGGGIWNWLDPLTLVRAWPAVARRVPSARLVFLGTRHPNPAVPRHEMAEKAQDLAASLGGTEAGIVFIEWVDLATREALLAEAAVGVSLHPVHVETRYSVRARVIDYFWARLPVVVTDGDVAAEWVRSHAVGRVVPPSDEAAAAEALVEVLERPRPHWEAGYDRLNASLQWSNLVGPLRRYCLDSAPPAPDGPRARPNRPRSAPPPQPGFWSRVLSVLHRQGPRAFVRRSAASARHRLSRRP